jgi:hypothetical protein
MSIDGVKFEDAWSHRVESKIGDVPVLFISKEDLIAAKTAAGRPQDILDVQTLISS